MSSKSKLSRQYKKFIQKIFASEEAVSREENFSRPKTSFKFDPPIKIIYFIDKALIYYIQNINLYNLWENIQNIASPATTRHYWPTLELSSRQFLYHFLDMC